MSSLNDSVSSLPGVGGKRAAGLARLGLYKIEDFLTFFPRGYEDRTRFSTIFSAVDGDSVCVKATVAAPPATAKLRGNLTLTKLRVFDDTGVMNITYFNNPYVKNRLIQGREYIFFGRIEARSNVKAMLNPAFDLPGAQEASGRILPVYRLTQGVTQKMISSGVAAALKLADGRWQELLPPDILRRNELCGQEEAYHGIHFPADFTQAERARRRLIFEELFVFCCAGQRLKNISRGTPGASIELCPPDEFLAGLPFEATGAQRRSIDEIFRDMAGGSRMNRLLQGDVGSGKTMVAAAAAWLAAKSGKQSAVMAPTELLAAQHHRVLSRMLAPFGITCELLTSSLGAAEKRWVKQRVASGECHVLCGTHAVIQSDVVFSAPGLFVVDEQHRFGVRQRATLSEKGEEAHLLVMSATPIPRTLTLIIYGELDVSLLDELPPGRQKILTYSVGEDKRGRMLGFIEKQVRQGGQAYVVCPLIEAGESERESAVEYAMKLERELPGLRIGLVHGKLRPGEKSSVMAAFSAHELDVLVSTTVIEVGVDVPNASLMVIEEADIFGLSQLHQLRGRVGRGERQSFCILMRKDPSQAARARLKALCDTDDGFVIAEEDLRLRGPGDFFGNRQHGLPEFRIADLNGDTRVIRTAHDEAESLCSADRELNMWPELKKRVDEIIARARQSGLN